MLHGQNEQILLTYKSKKYSENIAVFHVFVRHFSANASRGRPPSWITSPYMVIPTPHQQSMQ